MIGEKNDIGISRSRMKGYIKALSEVDIKFSDKNVLVGTYNSETAYAIMRKFLKQKLDVTAVFSISDVMALGIARAVVDEGLTIGEDISIIGFDGMDISKFYNPGITTIKQPKREMAKKSAQLLLDLINDRGINKQLILKTELIERESCKVIQKRKG